MSKVLNEKEIDEIIVNDTHEICEKFLADFNKNVAAKARELNIKK